MDDRWQNVEGGKGVKKLYEVVCPKCGWKESVAAKVNDKVVFTCKPCGNVFGHVFGNPGYWIR